MKNGSSNTFKATRDTVGFVPLVISLAGCSSSATSLPPVGSQATSSHGSAPTSVTSQSLLSPSAPSPSTASSPSSTLLSSTPSTITATSIPVGTLPIGDGNVLSKSAKVGYVDSCSTLNTNMRMVHGGPWIDSASGTWTPSLKAVVQGSNYFSNAYYHMSISGGVRTISTDSVPVNMPVGNFPISPSDPAYQYDTNPNHVTARALNITLPANPTVAQSVTCLPQGAIGVLTNGVKLYSALDAGTLDAVAHETQDSCGGHPDRQGTYHYHDISPCVIAQTTHSSSTLVGYALDGFGIYVERNSNGSLVTNSQLDQCHGRISPINWDGQTVTMFHYDATNEYPYTLGCFEGTITQSAVMSIGDPPPAYYAMVG